MLLKLTFFEPVLGFSLSLCAMPLLLLMEVLDMDRLPLVLSSEESQNMQEIPEAAHREQLGQQMVGDLLDISELTDQPIKHMVLNKTGVFEEADISTWE